MTPPAQVLSLLLTASILLMGASGCGADEAVATVGGTKISRDRVEATLEHAKEEAEREGHAFPSKGTEEYRSLELQALALLVYHEELEQRAATLGVRVSDEEVEARAKLASDEEGGGKAEEDGFAEESTRAGLLYRKVFDRITSNIRVSDAEIARFYRAHRGRYQGRRALLPEVRGEIRQSLVDEKRNAAMAAWIAEMRRQLDPKVSYAKGFGPPRGP